MTAPFTPGPAIDEDRYRDRIGPALEEIHERGNLLRFEPNRDDRLALMQVLSVQGLMVWSRVLAKYQLTHAGEKSLAAHRNRFEEKRRA